MKRFLILTVLAAGLLLSCTPSVPQCVVVQSVDPSIQTDAKVTPTVVKPTVAPDAVEFKTGRRSGIPAGCKDLRKRNPKADC